MLVCVLSITIWQAHLVGKPNMNRDEGIFYSIIKGYSLNSVHVTGKHIISKLRNRDIGTFFSDLSTV